MSFPLVIATIAALDLGLLALLAFVMGLPRKLAPHRQAREPALALAESESYRASAFEPRRLAA